MSIESVQSIGQPYELMTTEQIKIFQKAEYAGCMLFIANMGCARISLCLLIRRLLSGCIASLTALGFACFTMLWTFIGVLVTAFPCALPNPWQADLDKGKKCINLVSWVNYIAITNIVVEILLVSIPLIVWNLRVSAGRRLSVSIVFLLRLT